MVTERITLNFVGEWHGIHRTIPIEYPGPNGTNYELFLKVTSVTDESGKKLKYESSTSSGARDLKIYIPDAVDATRTVEITLSSAATARDSSRITTNSIGTLPATIGQCRSITRPRRCNFQRSRGFAESAGFYRRLWLDAARCQCRRSRRRGAVRDQ